MVEAVSRDHEAAAGEGDENFHPVGGQGIAPEGSGEDAGEADDHENKHVRAAVAAVAGDEG